MSLRTLLMHDGLRECGTCGGAFVGPGWRSPEGVAECLRCRPVEPGTTTARAMEELGFRPSGEHVSGDPFRDLDERR